MPKFIEPIQLTVSNYGSWQDVDVSSYVSAKVTGVILHITSNYKAAVGYRKNGSTDNRIQDYPENSHSWASIGVDGNKVFELYIEDSETIVYLEGYYEDEAHFLTNGIDKSLSTAYYWVDIDISAETGSDTALAAIFEVVSVGNNTYGLRKKGVSDRLTGRVAEHSNFTVGLNQNEVCQGYINNYTNDFYLIGWIKSNVVFLDEYVKMPLAQANQWLDLPALPEGASGGYILARGTTSYHTYGLRKNGSTENIIAKINNISQGIVECDENGIIEGIVGYTASEFYLIGYIEGQAAPVSIPMVPAGEIGVSLPGKINTNVNAGLSLHTGGGLVSPINKVTSMSLAGLVQSTGLVTTLGEAVMPSTTIKSQPNSDILVGLSAGQTSAILLKSIPNVGLTATLPMTQNSATALALNQAIGTVIALPDGVTLLTNIQVPTIPAVGVGFALPSIANISTLLSISPTNIIGTAILNRLSASIKIVPTVGLTATLPMTQNSATALALNQAIGTVIALPDGVSLFTNIQVPSIPAIGVDFALPSIPSISTLLSISPINIIGTAISNRLSTSIKIVPTVGLVVPLSDLTMTNMTARMIPSIGEGIKLPNVSSIFTSLKLTKVLGLNLTLPGTTSILTIEKMIPSVGLGAGLPGTPDILTSIGINKALGLISATPVNASTVTFIRVPTIPVVSVGSTLPCNVDTFTSIGLISSLINGNVIVLDIWDSPGLSIIVIEFNTSIELSKSYPVKILLNKGHTVVIDRIKEIDVKL